MDTLKVSPADAVFPAVSLGFSVPPEAAGVDPLPQAQRETTIKSAISKETIFS